MSSGATSSSASSVGGGDFQLPALRSFDDFTARFQLPNFKDFDKWGNRVVKNLIYYQTNYFLIFIFIYFLMLMINPMKIICGLFVQAFIIAVVLYAFMDFKTNSQSSGKRFIASRVNKTTTTTAQQQHKWYILAGALFAAYLVLYWFEAFLITNFTILLPVSLTFIHASLRLRNIKNKLVNTMDNIVPTNTPMSAFLDAFNITVDGILN